MPTEHYSPAQVAKLLNVHSNTVRLWCRDFTEFLSPTANPPAGTYRQFTANDLAVFTHIADLSRLKMPLPVIRNALRNMPAAELHAPVLEGAGSPVAAQDGPQHAEGAISVVHTLDALPAAIVERLSPLLSAEFERGRELGRAEARRRVPPEYVLVVALVAMAAMVIASMIIMR